MGLTLQEQYDIYTSYEEIENSISRDKMSFDLKGSKSKIGFEYRILTEDNKNNEIKSGYIRIDNLRDNKLITETYHNELSTKASHYSGRTQKKSKGCISTFDLTEHKLRNLIELNIKLISGKYPSIRQSRSITYNNTPFNSIRLLPMSMPLEFEGYTIEEIQKEFFMRDIIEENSGEYHYRKSGMNIDGNALVLFQYLNTIVASAILEDVVEVDDEIYKGKYIFDTHSIAIFENISSDELKEIFDIKQLSQSKQILDIDRSNELLELLEEKNIEFVLDNEIDYEQSFYNESSLDNHIDQVEEVSEACESKHARFKRSQIRKSTAIKLANHTCELDHTHMTFRSKTTGENYVEAHHLIPMKYQYKFDNSIDVASNIIALCPNCHRYIHHGDIEEKEDTVIELYNKRLERLKKTGINIEMIDLIDMYI